MLIAIPDVSMIVHVVCNYSPSKQQTSHIPPLGCRDTSGTCAVPWIRGSMVITHLSRSAGKGAILWPKNLFSKKRSMISMLIFTLAWFIGTRYALFLSLSLYVYVYVCALYIYTYIYTYIHICIYIYINIYI